MKKTLLYLIVLVLMMVLCACSSSDDVVIGSKKSSSSVQDVIYESSDSTAVDSDNTSSIDDNEEEISSESETSDQEVTSSENTPTSSINTPVCAHTFANATCETPQKCTKCNAVQGAALGHSFAAASCELPKKCTRCQSIQGTALGHSFANATCQSPQKCTVCGATQGSVGNHSYVTGECTVCGDYSESYCPKLYFTGNMSNMNDKKDVRDIAFEYRSKDQKITGAAKIKPQGSSSLGYAKKNYTINLYSNSQYTQKLDINVGWGKQSEYCLKANWIDKTHSRNVVSAKLVGEMQEQYGILTNAPNNGAIDGFPVEIYINGSFHGLYTMNIPKSAWMFNMDENNPNHIVLCGENYTAPVLFKDDPNLNVWSVEVGPENNETLNKFKRLTDFIRFSTDEEFKTNFEQYLNLDATLNYYVMMYYGWMQDNPAKNMLLATYDGEVWYPSLYDLDTTWGTDWQGLSIYDYKNGEMQIEKSVLWTRFEELYSKEIAERYFELRSTVFDRNHVMDTFESFYNSIPAEIKKRETEKWGSNIPGYDLTQIRDYLDSYIPRLDEKFKAWR